MTIHLPDDLENRIEAALHRGQFRSVDEALAEAARRLLRDLDEKRTRDDPARNAGNPGLGFIGALRDDADWLDQAVEHAMKVREERPWRPSDGE